MEGTASRSLFLSLSLPLSEAIQGLCVRRWGEPLQAQTENLEHWKQIFFGFHKFEQLKGLPCIIGIQRKMESFK